MQGHVIHAVVFGRGALLGCLLLGIRQLLRLLQGLVAVAHGLRDVLAVASGHGLGDHSLGHFRLVACGMDVGVKVGQVRLVRALLNAADAALQIVVALAQEVQLQLVAADGLVAALLALELF